MNKDEGVRRRERTAKGFSGHTDYETPGVGSPVAFFIDPSAVGVSLPPAAGAQILTSPKGDRLAVLPFEKYCELISNHELSKEGTEALSQEELEEFKKAANPLEFWRKKRGLSRAEVANAVGISAVALWQHERNRRGRSLELYGKLARLLGVRIDDLYSREMVATDLQGKSGKRNGKFSA